MCGICGIISLDGSPPDADLVRAMCARLVHRGPDASGVTALGSACLGSRRLRVIDLAGGDQPILDESGRRACVVNGEIYNFARLRAELEGKGHRFASRTDAEVVVHLFEEDGDRLAGRLEGMFALAATDGERLLLARDHAGIKPLYYHDDGRRLAFASELWALLALPDVPRELDPEALSYYLSYGFIPGERCILRGVKRLPAGHQLVVGQSGSGAKLSRWWKPPSPGSLRVGRRDAAAMLRESLEAALRSHLVADVPVGAFLSGGFDSSALCALAASMGVSLRALTIGFEEEGFDERPYAEAVAKQWGLSWRTEVISEERLIKLLPRVVRHLDEPLGDSSAIPTYAVSSLARDELTVAISGDGGDELLGGYPRHLAAEAARMMGPLRPLAAGVCAAAAGAIREGDRIADPARRLRRLAAGLPLPADERYAAWMSLFPPDELRALAGSEVPPPLPSLLPGFAGEEGGEAMALRDAASYLPDDLLTKVDRMSMAVSLEVRVPFLDRRVWELCLALPWGLKFRRFSGKRVLLDAVGDLLPASVRRRGKHGFAVPIGRWLRGELSWLLDETLLSQRFLNRGLVREEALHGIIKAHREHRVDRGNALWSLVVLELWIRRCLEGAEKPW